MSRHVEFLCRLNGLAVGKRVRRSVIREDFRVQLLHRLPHTESRQLKWIRHLVKMPSIEAKLFRIQEMLGRLLYISNWPGSA